MASLAAAPTEPSRTIYFQHWKDARARVRRLSNKRRKLFSRLLTHVDTGWTHVRRLQLFYERAGRLDVQDPILAATLDLIDGDIVDIYRLIAGDSAALVPGWDGWPGRSETGDLDGEATLFARYMTMLRLAVDAPNTPSELRELVQEVAENLEGWSTEFCNLMRAIDAAVIAPMLGGLEPPSQDGSNRTQRSKTLFRTNPQ